MRILGIDPGSRFTGWGLLQREGNRTAYLASGTLRLDPARPLAERLLRLADGLEALLAEHRPEQCALERIFTSRNARSALVLGHARGVILCAVARHGIPLHEYTAGQVKQAVVGRGAASKGQVQQMVAMLLGLPRERPGTAPRTGIAAGIGGNGTALGEDEADALAIALAHAAATRGVLAGAGTGIGLRGRLRGGVRG